jgi:acyl-CoA synthetase (AMP-forming)/AMP-acid ligase II
VIETEFQTNLKYHPDRPFVVCSSGQKSYADFHAYVCRLAAVLDELEPGRLCCHLPDSPELIALIYAAAMSGRSLALFNHDYNTAQLQPLIELTEATFIVTDIDGFSSPTCAVLTPDFLHRDSIDNSQINTARSAVDSEILILTSGTTGQPKCARYQWSKLLAQVKKSNDAGAERWLLAYRLNHFAGIQMIAHALCNGSTLVLADSTQMPDMMNALIDHQVTHVSSTPTFWRFAMALLRDRQDKIKLQHITLGSEATSGDLLTQLHELFPAARIVHIYASTEAGSCVSVSDMKPGLPASILDRPAGSTTEFRIVEDELYIKSLHGMSGYLKSDSSTEQVSDDGWRATGDLVRVEDERIVFVGRKNETINVGGVKVHPLDVEGRITPLGGVKLVRAYGRKNPVVGHIVAVDVVCNEGYESAKVEEAIRAACEALVPAARPRSINFVDAILTNNMKLSRQ